MPTFQVKTASGPYTVVCQRGALSRLGTHLRNTAVRGRVFVLSSPRVWKHWGRVAERSLGSQSGVTTLVFDDRERAKNLQTVEQVCRRLVRARADRDATLVALGGGVVGDVAGFVAASFLRGVRLVQVPTTLVAQVDSAIGGKTGVNLPEGKNLVGAFYPASLVVADPETLQSLPTREYRSGIYEVIKYGVVADAELFEFLEGCLERLATRDSEAVDWVIPRCIAAKAAVVSRDERESGLRMVLNFGHTFGHALEAATRYRRYLHGEAVGWGMIAAARLAVKQGMLAPKAAQRIEALTRRVRAMPALPRLDPTQLVAAMRADKKARGGKLRFVLPVRIGKVTVSDRVEESAAREVWKELQGSGDQGRC